MPRSVWLELEKKHRLAVHAYSDAVDRLDTEEVTGFELAWGRIEKAWQKSVSTRTALLDHAVLHGFDTSRKRPE